MENERKSPEELANLKKNIRRLVETVTGETSHDTSDSVSFEVDSLFTDGRKVVPDTARTPSDSGDDFWNLGRPKPRVYKKPDFSDTPVELTAVDNTIDPERDVTEPEAIASDVRPAKTLVTRGSHSRLNYRPADNTDILSDLFDDLPERTTDETVSTVSSMNGMTIPERPKTTTATTSDGRQTIVHDAPPRYPTGSYGSYKRHGSFNPQKNAEQTERRKRHTGDEILAKYTPDGLLLREVEVRNWTSDIDFYERFLENAEKSHTAQSSVPYTSDYPRVSYFSYVPQYSHMSRAQLDFYRWVRENIRHGRYPDCDPSYIQLYIYEILNLPELIPPEYGAAQLAGIWLHYRRTEPRLDGYLCEWLPDYCMIHACPMPEKIKTILPEIVPKAQFKEFYLDFNPAKAADEDYLTLAKTFIEVSSDYDYRRSRYYKDNRDAYEHHLPLAVVSVIKRAITAENGRGVFAREKTYKMSRDSYCGAIVSISVKRRMNIEFCSFTRSAETRRAITAIVKYAENKLRLTLGIKSKLGVDGILPEDSAILDAYFAPMLPQKTVKPKEDQYMPDDYLKNYESEDSGFDFGAAAEIERLSWQNTTLLTQGEFEGIPELTESGEDTPDLSEAIPEPEETPVIPEPEIPAPEIPAEHPVENSAAPGKSDDSDEDVLLREALSAALNGHFHDFCRDHQIYDGVLADRINTKFLDILGDIVLEENGKSYIIIEDYREDIETWMEE